MQTLPSTEPAAILFELGFKAMDIIGESRLQLL